jgi:uncharacterized coiled-coil protein SlyX
VNRKKRIAELEAENGHLRITIAALKKKLADRDETIDAVRKAIGPVTGFVTYGGGGAGGYAILKRES